MATLKQSGYAEDDDERHFVLEAICGVNSIHLITDENAQLFWDFVDESIGRERESGEPLTRKDLNNIKTHLDNIGTDGKGEQK